MFNFLKKEEIKKKDINQGYRDFEGNPEQYVIICVDEQKDFDDVHIKGAECLPYRAIDKDMEDIYPEKDKTYYVYAINPAVSKNAYKKLNKLGYDVYDLGSILDFTGREEGMYARRKRRRR